MLILGTMWLMTIGLARCALLLVRSLQHAYPGSGCRGNIARLHHRVSHRPDPNELFDEAVVDVSNGQLVRLPELSSRLTDREKGSVSCFRYLQFIVNFTTTRGDYIVMFRI
jgi:hypothetical protein